MIPVDFVIKDADLVGFHPPHDLVIEGLDRNNVKTRFTVSVVAFDKLRAQYKSQREEFEAEVVRQSLDEPATDHMGHELPEELQ